MKQWTLANSITIVRIAGTIGLFFLEVFKPLFYIVYVVAGLTDILDGYIARKTKTTSEFGAKLDSAADLLFYSVVIFRIFPVLYKMLPRAIWWMVNVVVLLRIISYAIVAIKFKKFASLHTYLNKLTSGSMFFIPFFIYTSIGVGYCWLSCTIALIATVEELIIHITRPVYNADEKFVGTRDSLGKYLIRRLKVEEVDEALDLVWNTFLEFEAPVYEQQGVDSFRNEVIDNKDFRKTLSEGKNKIWGAFDKGKLVGVFCMRGISHICLAFIHRNYHRKGIATALFNRLVKEIKKENPEVNKITVNSSPYGVPFYHYIGFVDTDVERTVNGIRFTSMEYVLSEGCECKSH